MEGILGFFPMTRMTGIFYVKLIFLRQEFFLLQNFFPLKGLFPFDRNFSYEIILSVIGIISSDRHSFFGRNSSCHTIFYFDRNFPCDRNFSRWHEILCELNCSWIFPVTRNIHRKSFPVTGDDFLWQYILHCGRKESLLPGNWCATEMSQQNCLPIIFLSKCVM